MLVKEIKSGVHGLLYRPPFDQLAAGPYANYYLGSRNPVLIYTSPKTGSSTVASYLKRTMTRGPVYKVHFLSGRNLEVSASNYRRENNAEPPIIVLSRFLSRVVNANPDINWRIITLTREPFSRAVSALFQVIERRHPEMIDRNGGVLIDKAVEHLQGQLTSFEGESTRIFRWFDEELKTVFGIDVYQQPFNHEEGFTVLTRGNVKILIIRLEDLDRSLAKGVSRLTGVDMPARIPRLNTGKGKHLSEAYERCRRRLSLPREVCRDICNSRYVRHFYNEEEREQLIARYSQPSAVSL